MSSQVPPAIKAADLARFATRALQLEKAKPVISYYCNFWIVNQVLAKDLHSTDEDCLVYTSGLMEKLEQFKADNRENDVVMDETAGRAYVEQFGLETFQRADNAVRANKASRQTADTFQAAATFLELLQIWGEIDPENAAKIKYGKYHALRIAKALKAGEDPNASNPAPESNSPEDVLPALDPNDAEVQMLNGASSKPRQASVIDVPDEAHNMQRNLARQSSLDESLHPSRASPVPRPNVTVPRPKVEEVPDETDRMQSRLARQSSLDQSLHPSQAPSNPPPNQDEVSPVDNPATAEDFYNQSSQHDVSPMGPEPPGFERQSSIGGNYFPQVPAPDHQHHRQQPAFTLPSAPSDFTSPPPEPTLAPTGAPKALSPPTFPFLPQTQHPPFLPPIQPGDHSRPTPLPPASPYPPGTPHQPPHYQPQQQQQHPYPLPPQSYTPYPLHPMGPTPLPPPSFPTQTPKYTTTTPAAAAPPPPPPSTTTAEAIVDEAAIAKAQKHARWAISALNFEDVPTAIRELRGALETLGER